MIKCPHCSNEDGSMIELTRTLNHVIPVVYQYTCQVCSKSWFSETKKEN